jgi:ubiquinone/menaquinone biosynthesis C-methylase UbiE
MAYKKPSLEVLQIGGVSIDIISAVLPALQPDVNSTHRFSRYVVADFSSTNVTDAEMKYESMKPEMSFKHMDSDTSLNRQGFLESSFDVVLIATDLIYGAGKQRFISDTQKFLRPGGKTVVLEAVRPVSDT